VLGVAALVLVVVGLTANGEPALVLLAIDTGLLWVLDPAPLCRDPGRRAPPRSRALSGTVQR